MTIQGIGQIAVPISNLEEAIHFYQEKLELPLLFNTGNMAFFDCQGVRLLLSMPEGEQHQHSSSVIYFRVENIQKTFEDYIKKGITFIDEPHLIAKMGKTETWMTFFKDPFDNLHGLMSEFETE